VLRHELAHVVAGSFGQGPFAVGGPVRGIIPDPGRIEGVAEAAAPDEDADLTLQQWARAMRDLEQLPALDTVFRLTFLAHNAATAYTVAGAFVDWLHRTHGPAVIRQWYGGATLETATGGKTLAVLEQEWRRSLDEVDVPAAALHAARWRFDRPAIFGRRCPRQVDAATGEAGALLGSGDTAGARLRYERVLALDPGHLRARRALGTCSMREANLDAAHAAFGSVASDPRLTALQRAMGEEDLGDLALARGNAPAARSAFAAVARVTLEEDALRNLDLKLAATTDRLKRAAIVNLLVGQPPHAPDWGAAAAQLGEWSAARPQDGTPDYILGRNFFLQGRWELAADYLDRSLTREFELHRVRDEALRVRLLVACALEDVPSATRAFRRWERENTSSEARRAGTRSRARRCGVSVD
jgi:tetratricopeptide (TPR) repeat protein